MSLVLEYARRETGPREAIYSPIIFQILLVFAHINICWQISRTMIVSVSQHAGTNFTAWTPAAWLPGTIVSNFAGELPGMLCMCLASVIAAKMMYRLLVRYRDGLTTGQPLTYDGQLWLTLALWLMWLPVPATDAFIYHFSDWAITH